MCDCCFQKLFFIVFNRCVLIDVNSFIEIRQETTPLNVSMDGVEVRTHTQLGVAPTSIQDDEETIVEYETFGKTYESSEETHKRMVIFSENMGKIEAHNALYEQGQVTWKLGVTQFSDLTEEEFLERISFRITPSEEITADEVFMASEVSDAPDSIDWREKNAVLEVKNQGGCGSCWSFSATGAMEGLMQLTYNRSFTLSEQNLIDCATQPDYSENGCGGGLMTEAFKFVKDKGIETEQEYPYEGVNGQCRQNRVVFQIGGFANVAQDEESLRQAVGTIGPISVGIEATGNLQQYTSGILYDQTCGTAMNHGVLAVGYGSENGEDYWLIKNSWGADWGEQGFFRLARNKNNNCFISNMASYPTM